MIPLLSPPVGNYFIKYSFIMTDKHNPKDQKTEGFGLNIRLTFFWKLWFVCSHGVTRESILEFVSFKGFGGIRVLTSQRHLHASHWIICQAAEDYSCQRTSCWGAHSDRMLTTREKTLLPERRRWKACGWKTNYTNVCGFGKTFNGSISVLGNRNLQGWGLLGELSQQDESEVFVPSKSLFPQTA